MNFKTKLLGAAVLPVILISIASFWVIQFQSERLAEQQISNMETRTLNTRRAELQKMNQLALNSIRGLYEDSSLTTRIAQKRAKQRLHDMAYGEDGYFFVYDASGTNLVHPRLPNLVGKNWWNLQDPNGNYVIRNLVKQAKAGGGFHDYVWNKPSSGELVAKIGHAVYLEKWGWMVGTGLYLDDVEAEISTMRDVLQKSINQTKTVLLWLSLGAVLLATIFTWSIRLNEQKFADRRLKELTHRIVEVQEDERKRVSRELHDGISQLLVSARYGLDQVLNRVEKKSDATGSVKKAMTTIESAISEVRRISMALRPSVLDDIGLAAAISSLGRDYTEQSGTKVTTKAQRIGKRASSKAQTALYRVVQEALTNIAKHSEAQNVWVKLYADNDDIHLSIEDDGELQKNFLQHLSASGKDRINDIGPGMGLRNMRERMDAFQGSLHIDPSPKGGLAIKARIPIDASFASENSAPQIKSATHAT